jgi:hypothetical protein
VDQRDDRPARPAFRAVNLDGEPIAVTDRDHQGIGGRQRVARAGDAVPHGLQVAAPPRRPGPEGRIHRVRHRHSVRSAPRPEPRRHRGRTSSAAPDGASRRRRAIRGPKRSHLAGQALTRHRPRVGRQGRPISTHHRPPAPASSRYGHHRHNRPDRSVHPPRHSPARAGSRTRTESGNPAPAVQLTRRGAPRA